MKKNTIAGIVAILFLSFGGNTLITSAAPLTPEAAPPVNIEESAEAENLFPVQSSQEESASAKEKIKESGLSDQTGYLNLPAPELPVLNLDNSGFETSSTQQVRYANIDTQEITSSVAGSLLNNQIRIVLVVFLGAISGAILALILLLLMRMIRRRSR